MFDKKSDSVRGRSALVITGVGNIDLYDTFECGQAFRYELICREEAYVEYMTVIGRKLVRVGQRARGELIFYGVSEEEFTEICAPYFALSTDFEKIREVIVASTDSDWLKRAAESAKGIVILKQDPWETIFSFIISQNNNIPRIRKIIRALAAAYGENLAVTQGLSKCPAGIIDGCPSETACRECGRCYSFPTPEAIAQNPEKMLPSKPGFRYKYLLSSAQKVLSGEVDIAKIAEANSYGFTLTELKKISGVGDKVASCAALFGFSNLDAFPVDVWMKKAIDEYFGGYLDTSTLGGYAGVAQQYIFHYVRNLNGQSKSGAF